MIIKFRAEIREVKAKKLVCLDKEITVKLNTSNIIALELGKIDSDKEVRVTIKEL